MQLLNATWPSLGMGNRLPPTHPGMPCQSAQLVSRSAGCCLYRLRHCVRALFNVQWGVLLLSEHVHGLPLEPYIAQRQNLQQCCIPSPLTLVRLCNTCYCFQVHMVSSRLLQQAIARLAQRPRQPFLQDQTSWLIATVSALSAVRTAALYASCCMLSASSRSVYL
jgi:hypothetical protein